MSADSTQYFCGTFEVGRDADWDHVARAIDLMRASGIALEPASALEKGDGTAAVPFFACSGNPLAALVGAPGDPRARIEEMSPWKLGAYKKVDPRTATDAALTAMAKLSREVRKEDCRPLKASDVRPRRRPAAGGDAFAGLVGLQRQRRTLEKVANLVAKHGRQSLECLHMVFSGAPGTGKTELAMRLSAHLDALGVTDGRGTFVKAGASDLVAHYVGQTPSRTRAVVERALGGVLFVDEVYSLLAASSYGQEAIDTLVEALEEERGRLVCVVAGYPEELERVFARNAGLRDRFAFRLDFDDYTVEELELIFCGFASSKGFLVAPEARGELRRELNLLRDGRDFANARTARRLFDRAIMETAMRCDGTCIEACDLKAAFGQPDLDAAPSRPCVGF